ncbi:hypothetical protein FA95DRAFT_1490569, partial [Auriscalpium vulgare]
MRVLELRAIEAGSPRVLKEAVEPRRQEAERLNTGAHVDEASISATAGQELSLATSVRAGDHVPVVLSQHADLVDQIKRAYAGDATFGKIAENTDAYPTFEMDEGIITTKNRAGERVVCIPKGLYGKRSIIEFVIDQGHQVLGHMGTQKTADYLR